MSFYYLATPYSKYPGGIEAAYVAACEQAAVLVRAGVPVFCPIAHTHGVAIAGGIDPLSHDIWLPADEPFMKAAAGLIICRLPTWQDSYGVEAERVYFRSAGKPVFYMDPGEVPAALRVDPRQQDYAASRRRHPGWDVV